jgi:hypothetical protein
MSKLTIHLMILCTILILWGIFMLYINYKHKKRMKEIEEEWAERRRRWQLDRIDRQWSEVNRYWPTTGIRRSAMVPYDEVIRRTDKLSPKKKVGKHTMR